MPRWELKRLWVPLVVETRSDNSKQHTYYSPAWNDETRRAWAQAEALAADGWDLVSALAETGSHELAYEAGVKALGVGSSFTLGYLMLFKRPRS